MKAAVATPVASLSPVPATYAGLFVVTLTTLMYEVALTRIFSVTMWYHFAFLAISIALFGMTVGALIVYLRPELFRDEDLPRRLWVLSAFYAFSIALCFLTLLVIPFVPRWTVVGVYSVILNCLVIAIPFTLSGIIVCLVLTRFPSRVNRLYAADLLGAALGGIVLVRLFDRLDGPSVIIAIAAIAGIAAIAFANGDGSTRGVVYGLVALLGLGAFAFLNADMNRRDRAMVPILWAKEAREPDTDYELWNAFSRVSAGGSSVPSAPVGWGMSETLPADTTISQLGMTIDGVAGTVLTRYTGDLEETDYLRYDLTNLVHYIRNDADVLVIGVGGGRDLLSALEFEQKSVKGVEINPAILHTVNDVYGDFTGHLDRHPRVTMVTDEARSYLTRTDEQYDILQISLIDTWAATAAGAYALSENSLYTVEAWDTFFDRLKPGGVLSVSRWYAVGSNRPVETYRLVALAVEALRERGISDPRPHLLVYVNADPGPNYATVATLLVSTAPFSAADVQRVKWETARLEFLPVLTPEFAIDDSFLGLATPGKLDETVDSFNEDISPPTDNRPFFFQMANVKSFFNGSITDDSFVLRPVLILSVLALVVVLLTFACIILPLLLTTSRTAHRGMAPFYVYFAGIGLGFLMIEVAQLQRFSIFLGHPTYSLTVVLFSLLLFSGIGSMISEQVSRVNRPVVQLMPLVLLLATVIVSGFATPGLIDNAAAETTPTRIATAVAILAPMGLVMGMAFPVGMRMASTRPDAPTPFLWGINGATSVCASVVAMTIALFYGISAAFWTGTVCYAFAVGAMAWLALRPAAIPAAAPARSRRSPARARASGS